MKHILYGILTSILISFGYVANATAAQPSPQCAAIVASLPEHRCAETEFGIILSEAPFPRELVRAIGRGEKQFAAAFGQKPVRYLAVFTTSKPVPTDLPADIARLPVFTWSTKGAALVLKAISHGKEAAEPSEDQILDVNLGLYPHELGHFWLDEAYDPKASDQPVDGYGSKAPDWFDEASAFLSQDENSTRNSRRSIIGEYYRGSPQYRKSFTAHIAQLLVEPHPVTKLNIAQQKTALGKPIEVTKVTESGGTQELIIQVAETDSFDSSNFIGRTQFFKDYLLERARGKPVFGSIMAGYLEKRKFEEWLAQNGAQFHLPVTMADLQKDWEAWFTIRYGR